VSDPDFWNQDEVCNYLSEVLNFASADYWKFKFSQASPEYGQIPFEIEPGIGVGNPDSVHLFSGGLDSLCAAVEAAEMNGKHPLLLGHSPAFNVRSRQTELVKALRDRFRNGWQYPFIGAAIHRVGPDPSDYTERTRAFLFASLGAVIADGPGLNEVCLADNGVVSLNLHINDQLLAARASRSTHPKFIRLFNNLSKIVLPNAPKVTNPLWSRTRPETINILKDVHALNLIEETNSCSHGRYLTKLQSHCGTCSQCIDRRFATLAAGVEEYDPPERYKVDIFKQPIDGWRDRTMALSYVRFATAIENLNETQLFSKYSELYDSIDPNDANNKLVAEALIGLLKRHSQSVSRVMEDQISEAKVQLTRETLSSTCLIRLLAGSSQETSVFRHSSDYRKVWLRDEEFQLTTNQARVVELLYNEWTDGRNAISQAYILETLEIGAQNLAQVFRNLKAWNKLVVKATGQGMYRLNINPQ
jgi:7-cyano-7-deazaguanine synthase in queuosine biosynthesis